MNLDDVLEEVWAKVQRKHLFPELPAPQWNEGQQRVGLEIKGKKISLSKEFVEEMSRVLEPEEVIEGLLDHAISHYLYCPWDFSTHLKLYTEVKRVLKDKQMARLVADYFMDVVSDTHCVGQKESPIPKIYRHLNRGILDEVIHALYQRIWGVDLGVEGYEDISRKLSRLSYLDRRLWRESIRRFGRIVESVLETQEGLGDSYKPSPMGIHELHQYSSQEIEQGLREVVLDSDSPSEFKETIEDFEDEILGMGLGPGSPLDADILYYMKLAENYALPIRKTPMEKSGSLYPHHHVPWEVGKPYQDIDPWTSFGKIMPGITQTWKRLEGEVFGQEEGTMIPDCVVLIDSSGSMINPRQNLSYAVLGASCACDAYLRNDAKVAVYNFSDANVGGRRTLPYSRNRMEIYCTLCHYFGGGTRLLIKDIDSLQTDRIPDIFLITDMRITNLKMLMQYFNECKNRVTTVHIGNNERTHTFRRSMALRNNIAIYGVEKKEDIPRIVLGKIREYFHTVGP
ncbi:MAG: hypothetical protein ISS63_07360 [Desulfobacteraceae bacterium]|nr:hypothetical protein [Desulfobacteraceae bacterium]